MQKCKVAKHTFTIIERGPMKNKPMLVLLDGKGDVSMLLSSTLEDGGAVRG